MNIMNVRNSLLSNLDVLAIILVIAAWVILISDNPLTIYLGAITGLATGLVYYFVKTKQGKSNQDTFIFVISIPNYLIVLLFLVLVFATLYREHKHNLS